MRQLRPRIRFRCHTHSQPFQCEKLPLVAAHAHHTLTSHKALIKQTHPLTLFRQKGAKSSIALQINLSAFISFAAPLRLHPSQESYRFSYTHDPLRSRVVRTRTLYRRLSHSGPPGNAPPRFSKVKRPTRLRVPAHAPLLFSPYMRPLMGEF